MCIVIVKNMMWVNKNICFIFLFWDIFFCWSENYIFILEYGKGMLFFFRRWKKIIGYCGES